MAGYGLRETAKTALADCPQDKAFWIRNGRVIRNIYELKAALESMDLMTFIYHVNEDNHKNDFARWIYYVLGDEDLAADLRWCMEKDEYVEIISERIRELELA